MRTKNNLFGLILLFLIIASTLSANSPALNRDSLTLVNAQWTIRNVAPGITLRQIHFSQNELFSSNQFINILEISPSSEAKPAIIPSPILVETNVLAIQNEAVAAINGSFFKFNYERNTKNYNSVDYIRKNGEKIAPNTYTGPKRSMHQKGAIAIFNEQLYILKADELKDWERYIQAQHVITSGPLLMADGKNARLLQASFYTTRHPRTAIAKKEDGTIIFMTVDGRSEQSQGMSLEELRKVLSWMGATYILNLDGGGSTTMYVKGMSDNGVVNHPSDNKEFDNKGVRKVANIIMIK